MCLIEDQSWIDCIDITSRWDTFVSFHLYGNIGVSLPLWPIRLRWFHTYSPCAGPLGMVMRACGRGLGSQGSIALNRHSRYSGTRYSGTWLYWQFGVESWIFWENQGAEPILRCHLTSIGNPIVEIRRSYDRLLSTMGFPILVRRHLYIESGPSISWLLLTWLFTSPGHQQPRYWLCSTGM